MLEGTFNQEKAVQLWNLRKGSFAALQLWSPPLRGGRRRLPLYCRARWWRGRAGAAAEPRQPGAGPRGSPPPAHCPGHRQGGHIVLWTLVNLLAHHGTFLTVGESLRWPRLRCSQSSTLTTSVAVSSPSSDTSTWPMTHQYLTFWTNSSLVFDILYIGPIEAMRAHSSPGLSSWTPSAAPRSASPSLYWHCTSHFTSLGRQLMRWWQVTDWWVEWSVICYYFTTTSLLLHCRGVLLLQPAVKTIFNILQYNS